MTAFDQWAVKSNLATIAKTGVAVADHVALLRHNGYSTIADGVEAASRYHVEDWAGNRMFPDKTFATFEDGWEHVRANCPEDSWEDIYVLTPAEKA